MPLTYQGFYDLLSSYGCLDGEFLVPEDSGLVTVPVNFAGDRGVGLYTRKNYKGAIAYLCLANLSGANMRSLERWPYYFAGVDLSHADVSSSNLSQAVFEDALFPDTWNYQLIANLEDIVYNALTEWPTGIILPP
jgi:hypothetical protein